MPFGAIYGALFFAGFGFWAVFLSGPTVWGQTPAVRLCLFVLAFSLALGLLLGRRWARWGGVLFAAALAAVAMLVTPHDGTAGFVLLGGALATAILLAVPATGGTGPSPADPPAEARKSSPVLGWAATASALGLLVGLGWAAARPGGGLFPEPAEAMPASRLAERVGWTDFGSGLERARAENKPLLVTFVTNWCGYCRKMDRTTWKHPSVVERMGDVVAVRVDAEESSVRNGYRGSDLAGRYGITGYPAVLLLDGAGEVVARAGGYQEPRQLLGWLEDSFSRLGVAAPGNVDTASR